MFNKGIINGLKISIPVGGHFIPNSIIWVNLKWKNLQKKETKNKTSEVINSNIPIFIPINTLKEWSPCNVLSREISRHHWYIIIKVIKIDKNNIKNFFWWNIVTALINKIIVLNDLIKGQGL